VEGLTGAAALELARAAVLVSLAVIIARLVWVYFAGNFRWLLGRRLRPREPRPRWQVLTVVGWAGLRGGDTLILAAAIPTVTAAGMPFPGRDAIIALSYAVILVTLLGQGFTLAPLMRRLGVRETGEEQEREEIAARLRASEAALARLEQLASEPWMHPGAFSHTRDRYRLRTRHLRGHANGVLEDPIEAKSIAHLRLARELLAVERQELLRMRDNGAISDAVMRRVQQELDYEELLLHHE
jgi:monovalent cation/hydrogen antiporter